ncbi:uncharacterized protein DDB_G0271670-like [Macrobrachium nipponense]|uniref:uncharacterized protein DDB_G0271670-like n=1 Tax=Macrobrachium nipponense TaxID=159736 RepID=UPI0030C7FC6B
MDGMCVQQVERNHLLSLPRLLNNRMLELRQQFLMRPKKNRDQVTNLRQNLFGSSSSPSAKKENLAFADEELSKMTQADSQRWNFDIDAGTPMEEGHYHWELIHETNQALDTSGRLTCLTRKFASPAMNESSDSSSSSSSLPNGFATSSVMTPFMSSSSSPSSSSSSSKRAITTTTFSTSTTPTPVISKKCVKRLQSKSVASKVPKLITDYFRESKPVPVKYKDMVPEEKEVVSNRIVEILKIKSMNVR